MVLIELAGKPIGEVVDGLAARGIIVADAACFGGLGAHEAIRVSLRGPTVNDRLLAALKEIG
jgi:histidinol-phosphate/aromatic aminotransferase/cobyric acid decarboxylase-like protein